ncbi:MAG TPA: hypothetical protein VKF81_08670 [Blastocatellia bacterium]|nr:hypothetical protein [Blastocatellia bacterium]
MASEIETTQRLANLFRLAVLLATVATPLAASRIALSQSSRAPDGKSVAEKPASKSDLIPEGWPANARIDRLSDIGWHKAVIFSPDFAAPGNREFYAKLGFLYIEDASWQRALNQIIARNYWHRDDRIETIFLETHGTNGNGLKLQTGPSPKAARSYISIGALQEKLEGLGVRLCVIGACNSGRLFRPEIYKTLDPRVRDPLFLPATLGIINASKGYDPSRSTIIVARREESEIETTSDGDSSELSPSARSALGLDRSVVGHKPRILHFTVSNILVQMLLHDPRLKLTSRGYANEKSRNDLSAAESDALFESFVAYLNAVASREESPARRPVVNSASTR